MLKKTFLTFILLQLAIGGVFAQNRDSLHRVMHDYYDKHFGNPTDPSTLAYADTLLRMARQHNDTIITKLALGAKLDHYYYGSGEHNTDSVIAWVNRVKSYARKVKNPELFYWAWSAKLVNYYIRTGEYNIALAETEKMLKSAEKEQPEIQSKASIAECYSSLANIYGAKGLAQKSQEFMLKEIDLFEKYNLKRYHICFQYMDAAKIYIDQGKPEKAPELLKKALEQAKSPYHEVSAKLVYVSYYLAQNNIPEAYRMLEECRRIYAETPFLARHTHYLKDVEIEYYRATKDYNTAINILDEREKDLKDKGNISALATIDKTKADILWEMGRKEEAADLYKHYLEEHKKEKERNEEITTSEFATILNMQQLSAEKQALEKLSQEKQLQNTQIILTSVIGILCIVILFLYQQRKLNLKLKRSRDKLNEKNIILVEAEEELRKAKEKAEESSWMKTLFIQNMSHEIRTPLNSIVGFSAILADLFSDNEDIEQYATLIEDNSRLLLKLISDILDISALDNNIDIKRSSTEINKCCSYAIEAVQPFFQHKGIKLNFNPADKEKLIVTSNEGRVTQVLENLLNNAAKFTEAGEVDLKYTVHLKEKQVVFTITDTGIGIPLADQERVFERFVKLDDFSQGTGLGLPICRIIAEKLGGSLIIDKAYTKGTRFIFSIAM